MHISKTLKSVICQNFKNFEIVVVNDGSTDDSINRVKCFEDLRIRIIDQENAGVSAARNRGILEARGEFVAFLDADDEWNGEYLEHVEFLVSRYSECGVFACCWAFKKSGKLIMPRFKHIPNPHGILEDYIKAMAYGASPLWTSSVVVRKKSFEKTGLFNIHSSMGEDIDLWYRLSLHFKIAFYNKTLAYYNIDANNRLCKQKFPEGELIFFDRLRSEIDQETNSQKKYYKKKFLARSMHNIAKNNIKQGNFSAGIALLRGAPIILNSETIKCLFWIIFYVLNKPRH